MAKWLNNSQDIELSCGGLMSMLIVTHMHTLTCQMMVNFLQSLIL